MKTKLFSMLVIATLAFVACSEDDNNNEVCKKPDAKCPSGTEIQASSCCTASDCYWTYSGVQYKCDGTDCDSAIDKIITAACGTTSASLKSTNGDLEALKAELAAVTQQLLIEARACSACK